MLILSGSKTYHLTLPCKTPKKKKEIKSPVVCMILKRDFFYFAKEHTLQRSSEKYIRTKSDKLRS